MEKLEVKQELFRGHRSQAEAGRCDGVQHLLDHDRGHRPGAGRSRPADRHPLLQSGGADAAGGGRARPASREEEVKKGAAFVTAIDKFPLVVKSVPGFLVNRVLAPYMMGACSGSSRARTRRRSTRRRACSACRWARSSSPIRSASTSACTSARSSKQCSAEGSKLEQLVAAGKLGKKTGEGFYMWDDGKPQKADEAVRRSELKQLGRELIEPLIARMPALPRRARRGERRPGRRRRDLRHRLRAVPRRSAALTRRASARPTSLPLCEAAAAASHDGDSGPRWALPHLPFAAVRPPCSQQFRKSEGALADDHQTLRRVAVIGGVRIPFCRSNTLYADLSNLDMLTATLNGLVDRFDLKGAHIDEVVGGAVVTHSKRLEPRARGGDRHEARAATPGITMMQACGTSLQAAGGIAAKIATGADRVRHRDGLRHHVRPADRGLEKARHAAARCRHAEDDAGTRSRCSRASRRASSRRCRRPSPSRARGCRWASTAS